MELCKTIRVSNLKINRFPKDLAAKKEQDIRSNNQKPTRESPLSNCHNLKSSHVENHLSLGSAVSYHKEYTKAMTVLAVRKDETLAASNSLTLLSFINSDNYSSSVTKILMEKKYIFRSGLFGGGGKESRPQVEISHSQRYEDEICFEFKDILRDLYIRNPKILSQENLGAFNKINICNSMNILNLLADLTIQYSNVLMRIILIRKPQFNVASANSITILSHAKYSFEKLSLRGIYIEGADLSGIDLRRADLSGSKMKEKR